MGALGFKIPVPIRGFESKHGIVKNRKWIVSVRFVGSNPATDPKTPKCIYKISKNFRVEKNGEISRYLRFSLAFVAASFLTTHHVFWLQFRCLKGIFICKYNLDALCFRRRYTYPLAMIGGESFRYLPVFHTPCLQRNLCITQHWEDSDFLEHTYLLEHSNTHL